jgi:catechol 2,3-dioxygenase-like lactoylglutathione lyase family enzyme
VLEIARYVDDLARDGRFYAEVLGLRSLFEDERLRAFAGGECSVLLLFRGGASLTTATLPGGTIPPHDGSGPIHLAFGIGQEELPAWGARQCDTIRERAPA